MATQYSMCEPPVTCSVGSEVCVRMLTRLSMSEMEHRMVLNSSCTFFPMFSSWLSSSCMAARSDSSLAAPNWRRLRE